MASMTSTCKEFSSRVGLFLNVRLTFGSEGKEAILIRFYTTLRWRHNGHHCVSNLQPHDGLLNRLFRRRSKKTSMLRVTGLCAGNSPVTGEFPAQMTSNAENLSIWWSHHEIKKTNKKRVDEVLIQKSSGSFRSIWRALLNVFNSLHIRWCSVGLWSRIYSMICVMIV